MTRPGFSVRLPARTGSLETARLALLDFLESFDLGAAPVNRIEVVLEELVTNVARHSETAQTVTIEASVGDTGVVLSVEDDGEAFDPLGEADPDPFSTLEKARIGGLGIPLLKRLTKQVRYDRTDRGNRVTAVFASE